MGLGVCYDLFLKHLLALSFALVFVQKLKLFLDMDIRDQRQAPSKAGARKPWGFKIICTSMLETLTYNKGADQPAHPRSLISAFVIRCLKSKVTRSVICLLQREKLSGYAPERRCFRT